MARLQGSLLLAAALTLSLQAADVDPAVALTAAKSHIAERRFADAASLLAPAIDATASITDANAQKQARTALHFYAAVAYSGLGREDDAVEHLEEALRLSPQLRNIDRTKYDARFVSMFEKTRNEAVGTGRFEELYPGLSSAQPPAGNAVADFWENPAVEILGSREEKRGWAAAATPADRERFLESFWRSRDETPATPENEFRETFERRIRFAEAHFGTPGIRGAMSDRGRVLALLGEPARVRRRALNSSDSANLTVFSRNAIGIEVGTMEYWIYRRDQLPLANASPTITFRFVTHQGIGDFVMQKDGIPMNVLATVASRHHD